MQPRPRGPLGVHEVRKCLQVRGLLGGTAEMRQHRSCISCHVSFCMERACKSSPRVEERLGTSLQRCM
eukprot:3025701-Pyramimonas_sp.AAC.1